MSSNTPRLGLVEPNAATDNVSAFPGQFATTAGILDQAATYYEGTLAVRPGAGSVEHGRLYRTTDSGGETLTWHDGTVWLPLGLIPATTTTSKSAVSGQAVITTGSSAVTLTLPSHAAGQMVAVVKGTTNVTTVSGSSIQGVGLSSASSFLLGTAGASAILLDDGANWQMIAGQQDTGWQTLTPTTGWTGTARGKRVGAIVRLSGVIQNNTGSTQNNPTLVPSLPSNLQPPSLVSVVSAYVLSGIVTVAEMNAGSSLTVATPSGTVGNLGNINLEGVTYSLT